MPTSTLHRKREPTPRQQVRDLLPRLLPVLQRARRLPRQLQRQRRQPLRLRRRLPRPLQAPTSKSLALFGWDFLAFLTRLRKCDRDRLLRVRDLLSAASALQLALMHGVHLALDVAAGGRRILARCGLLRSFLRSLLCSGFLYRRLPGWRFAGYGFFRRGLPG